MSAADSTPRARMRRVRLLRSGRNQVVRIPKEFELEGEEVVVRREGSRLIIEAVEAPRRLSAVLASLEPLAEELPDVDVGVAPLDEVEI